MQRPILIGLASAFAGFVFANRLEAATPASTEIIGSTEMAEGTVEPFFARVTYTNASKAVVTATWTAPGVARLRHQRTDQTPSCHPERADTAKNNEKMTRETESRTAALQRTGGALPRVSSLWREKSNPQAHHHKKNPERCANHSGSCPTTDFHEETFAALYDPIPIETSAADLQPTHNNHEQADFLLRAIDLDQPEWYARSGDDSQNEETDCDFPGAR